MVNKLLITILLVFLAAPAGAFQVLRGSTVAGGGGSAPTFHDVAESPDGTSSGVTSKSTTDSLVVSAGDTIIVVISGLDTIGGDHLSDSVVCGSNNLAKIGSINLTGADSHWFSEIWAISNASAVTSVCTVTFVGSTTYSSIQAISISGAATSNSIDQVSSNSAANDTLAASSTSVTAQNVTTNQANELLVGWALAWDNDQTWSGANGYTAQLTGKLATFATKGVTAIGTYPNGNFLTMNTANSHLSFFITVKGL